MCYNIHQVCGDIMCFSILRCCGKSEQLYSHIEGISLPTYVKYQPANRPEVFLKLLADW